MIKDGRITTNGWLLIVFLVLTLTTTVNPLINNKYFALWWYPIIALYAIWVLVRIVYEEDAK